MRWTSNYFNYWRTFHRNYKEFPKFSFVHLIVPFRPVPSFSSLLRTISFLLPLLFLSPSHSPSSPLLSLLFSPSSPFISASPSRSTCMIYTIQ